MDPRDIQITGTDTIRLERAPDLQQNQVVGGRYEIIASLGEGGMGHVYRVNQIFLNKEFALKTININHVSETAVRRFQQEARTAFALDHPSIVGVKDFGVFDDHSPFLVMELVDGETLGERLKRVGCLTLDEAIPIFVQICFGLAYAHERGIVHRDIKPNNIMLLKGLPVGADGSVKIVDFGIAKFVQREEGEVQALTRTGEIFGSPLYMSPEQCTGATVDRRSDIYSLGCVFYEALTGAPPYTGDTALATMMKHQTEKVLSLKQASLGAEFPQAIEDIVAKMLEKAPENRYQDLGAVVHELGAMRRGETASHVPRRVAHAQTSVPHVHTRQRENNEGQAISMSRPKFYALLMATSLVSLAAGYVLHQPQKHTLSANGQAADSSVGQNESHAPRSINTDMKVFTNAQESQVKKLEAVFARAKPIKSTISTKNGVRTKQFLFPERTIGKISNLPVEGNTAENPALSWDAKGEVTVPAEVPLTLEVGSRSSMNVFEVPSILEKIDVNEFSGLAVTAMQRGVFVDEASEQPVSQTEKAVRILNLVKPWTNLQSVSLRYVTASPALMASLNNLRHVRELRLTECEYTSLTKLQPFLHRLKVVRLGRMSADNIIRDLSGSQNLQTLILDNDIQSVSPDALHGLSRCPNLQQLTVPLSLINERTALDLRQNKSLRVLHVVTGTLTESQRHILTGGSFKLFNP